MQQETYTELPKVLLMLISKVAANGKIYSNIAEWYNSLPEKNGGFSIIINPESTKVIKIKVKDKALSDTPYFKFNELFNNGVPIPMTEMEGIQIEEKEKMVKMDLWDKEHKIHWIGWLLKSWILEG